MDCAKFIENYCDFDWNLLQSINSNQTALDQDLHLTNQFHNIAACNYYHPVSPLFASKPSNSLFSLHVNIHTINKNFPLFYDLLQSLPNHSDIICISETWITHQPITNVSLPGYEFIHYPTKKRAGEVAMYVSTIYQYEITDMFNIDCDDCENRWIKLSRVGTNAKIIVGVVYGHLLQNMKTLFLP